MRVKYYISFNAGVDWSEFFPTNSPTLKLTKEPQEIFKRWRIDKFRIGRLRNQTVFTTLQGMFFDSTDFGTDIKYKITELGTDKYYFIAPVISGNFDEQNSVYEVNPDPDDLYRPILQKYQKKFDNTDPALIFGLAANYYYPKLATSVFVNSTFTTFTDISKNIAYTHDGSAPNERYAGNDITNPAGGTVVSVIISNLSYTGSAPTMVLVDAPGGTEYSNKVTISADGLYELLIVALPPATVQLEFAMNNLTGLSRGGSFDYEIYNPTLATSGDHLYDILDRVINNLSYMNLSYDIVSTILWNDALGTDPPASIDTYITANPTKDYVIEGTAIWNNIWLSRTDILTTDKEDNIELSLKDIMDILKLKLRMWWFIDEDDNIRIEHEKYFRSYDAQADLTTGYAADKPEVDSRVYSYDISDLYNQVNYGENNDVNEDWINFTKIEYPILQTSLNVKDIDMQELSTDILYVSENPDDANSNGLMLLRMDANDCVQFNESMITSGVFYPNQKLSWTWLTDFYFDYFAEAETGTNEEGAHTFVHVKEFLKQKKVKFRTTASILWYKPLTMSKGTGWIDEIEFDIESGMYSADVAFNPYDL